MCVVYVNNGLFFHPNKKKIECEIRALRDLLDMPSKRRHIRLFSGEYNLSNVR